MANSYVWVARVSKLKGLNINVIGSSFIRSTKVTINAIINADRLIGKWIFCNILKGPKPKFFAVSSKDSGCFSKLDLMGDFPTAKNLTIRA